MWWMISLCHWSGFGNGRGSIHSFGAYFFSHSFSGNWKNGWNTTKFSWLTSLDNSLIKNFDFGRPYRLLRIPKIIRGRKSGKKCFHEMQKLLNFETNTAMTKRKVIYTHVLNRGSAGVKKPINELWGNYEVDLILFLWKRGGCHDRWISYLHFVSYPGTYFEESDHHGTFISRVCQ